MWVSFSCDARDSHRVSYHVVDMSIRIYYPINPTKPPDFQREGSREKIKCELLCPLMSTLLFFLFSNPTLGNRETPFSIPLPGLIKHDHTATRSPDPLLLTKDPQPLSCKRSYARTHRGTQWLGLKFILGELNAAFILRGFCKSLFY